MAKAKLTKRTLKAAQPRERDWFLWDDDPGGFGLKITPSGHKVFILQYRMGGRGFPTRRYTLGEVGSPWDVKSARERAKELLAEVERGIDPQADKVAKVATPAPRSFGIVATDFMDRYAKLKTRDWRNTQAMLQHDVLPYWRNRPIDSLRKGDVIELIDRVTDRGATVHANRVLALVRKLFNWAIGRDLIDTNPAAGVQPPGEETARERVLDADELAAIWAVLEATPYPFGPSIRLLMLTAQRRDEVAGMRWSEISSDGATWAIPAARAKNGRTHEVPLSGPAQAILAGIPRQGDLDLVFSTNGKTPISGFGKAKARLDHLSGVEGWRLHDLRRTATTGMARAGIAPHVVDKVLNHVSGTIRGVAAVYNRFDYLPERRHALELWAHVVTGTADEGAEIVPLRVQA